MAFGVGIGNDVGLDAAGAVFGVGLAPPGFTLAAGIFPFRTNVGLPRNPFVPVKRCKAMTIKMLSSVRETPARVFARAVPVVPARVLTLNRWWHQRFRWRFSHRRCEGGMSGGIG